MIEKTNKNNNLSKSRFRWMKFVILLNFRFSIQKSNMNVYTLHIMQYNMEQHGIFHTLTLQLSWTQYWEHIKTRIPNK